MPWLAQSSASIQDRDDTYIKKKKQTDRKIVQFKEGTELVVPVRVFFL